MTGASDDGQAGVVEQSIDLTPGDVWTEQQLRVARDLAARVVRLEQALADERARTVARFLAICNEVPDIQPLWEFERGVLRGIEMTKAAICRAAQGGQ